MLHNFVYVFLRIASPTPGKGYIASPSMNDSGLIIEHKDSLGH
jgi:hypothetical protein